MAPIFQARLRVPMLALAALAAVACDSSNRLTDTSDPPSNGVLAPAGPSFASSFASSTPFGFFNLPMDQYNSTYTGAILYSYPENILGDLATVKRAGGRVIIDIVGNNSHYKNSDGTFSLSKWKQRIDRMRGVNFSSYIADGTIIGEFIMDEPHNPDNWGGTLVSRATIDEMARYSKSIWPSLPVVIRSWADYLKGYNYKYLDAAWAQYSERKGPVGTFIANNVRDAKATGLALVVGMNVLDGGTSASGIP